MTEIALERANATGAARRPSSAPPTVRLDPEVARAGNPAPLRVLTYLHSFDPGGVERVALRLNAAWAARGVDTTVIVGRDGGIARESATAVNYRRLDDRYAPARRFQLLWMLLKLPAIVRRERPDILFCAGNTYSIMAVGMRVILGRACPPVIAKVSNDLARRDMPPLLRFLYHRWLRIQGRVIDRFIAMAPPMLDEITDRMGVTADRITVINDPVLYEAELDRLAKREIPRAEPHSGRRFIAIGRLSPQKNFALLLDAFARIAAPEDRLTILGEGPDRAALTRRAATLGIADRLAMPGHVPSPDHWLTQADVLVMSSDYEGVPAVIVEAVAAGLALVATDCSVSMRDLLGGGRFGQLVPVGDVAALAEAMDQSRRGQECTASAHQHARAFTIEAGAAAYLAAMEQMAHSRVG